MKKIFSLSLILFSLSAVRAQEFAKQLDAARTSYSAGKLDDARFAMQQMLLELDLITGKEILKVLPVKMQDLGNNAANDNVSGASGFTGVIIHRDYGAAAGNKKIELEVISNSPLITSIN